MKTGIYYEDGWAAKVEILDNKSDEKWERYTLRVIKTIQESSIVISPEDNGIFSCERIIDNNYPKCWTLRDIINEGE